MPGVLLHDQKYTQYIKNENNYFSKSQKINKFQATDSSTVISIDHCYTKHIEDCSKPIIESTVDYFCTKNMPNVTLDHCYTKNLPNVTITKGKHSEKIKKSHSVNTKGNEKQTDINTSNHNCTKDNVLTNEKNMQTKDMNIIQSTAMYRNAPCVNINGTQYWKKLEQIC
jgi:hypothetical protein